MLEMYAREFVSICAFIIKYHPQQMCEKYVYIEPAQLREKLDKYKYDEADKKLRVWKNLGWLRCEPGHLTKNMRIAGEQRRVSVLDLEVYRQLKHLVPAGNKRKNDVKNEQKQAVTN